MNDLLIISCLSTQLKNLELIKIPFFNDKIPAGFPSPAVDFKEDDISDAENIEEDDTIV